MRKGAEGGCQGDEAGAGDACGALGGDQHDGEHGQLLGEAEVDAEGLGEEDRAHGQVDGGAVEVEGVPGGQRDADDRFRSAQVLELGHHAGQDGLGGGRAQDDQQFFLDVAQERQQP